MGSQFYINFYIGVKHLLIIYIPVKKKPQHIVNMKLPCCVMGQWLC